MNKRGIILNHNGNKLIFDKDKFNINGDGSDVKSVLKSDYRFSMCHDYYLDNLVTVVMNNLKRL